MSEKDIRWHQRLDNFNRALARLTDAVELSDIRPLTDLENQGLIQAFEFTYELSWNLIKDFYQEQGDTEIQGSRDAFRLAFKRGLITAGDIWMEMIKSRMQTSHTYNEKTAREISEKTRKVYYFEFRNLSQVLGAKLKQ